jgi:hypothetical protein
MPSGVLRLSPVLTLVFAALVVLVASRTSRADAQLRRFLTMPDCSTPCWQGIQVGVTTDQQALAILQHHPWIGRMAVYRYPGTVGDNMLVYWDWSGQQPDWLVGAENGALTTRNGTVETIVLQTTISLGDVWLLLGRPQKGVLVSMVPLYGEPVYYHHGAYRDGHITVRSRVACPLRLLALWEAPVEITLRADTQAITVPYNLPTWLRRRPC